MLAEALAIIHNWQTLAGVFSLCVALLVGYLARTREGRAAAMVLVTAFVNIMSRHETLLRLEQQPPAIPEGDHHKWLSEKLLQSRPKLSPTFEASVSRLMLVDSQLAVHLELFRMLHRQMDEHLDRLEEHNRDPGAPLALIRTREVRDRDAHLATDAFETAARHAGCAKRYLSLLVLGSLPTYHRIKRFLASTRFRRKM